MMAAILGFIACLFDRHDFAYVVLCHWNKCRRCGEVRLLPDELAARARR